MVPVVPVVKAPVVDGEPVVNDPVVTNTPVVAGPVVDSEPVVTGPVGDNGPVVTGPVVDPVVTGSEYVNKTPFVVYKDPSNVTSTLRIVYDVCVGELQIIRVELTIVASTIVVPNLHFEQLVQP